MRHAACVPTHFLARHLQRESPRAFHSAPRQCDKGAALSEQLRESCSQSRISLSTPSELVKKTTLWRLCFGMPNNGVAPYLRPPPPPSPSTLWHLVQIIPDHTNTMPNHGVAPNIRHPMHPVVPYSCYNIKNTWRRSAGAAGSLTKQTTNLLDAINCYNRDHKIVVGSSWCKLLDNSATAMEHLRCHSGLLDWTPAACQLISHTRFTLKHRDPPKTCL